ncbi:pirin family protein [Acinetobacter sp. 187]|uniref:pirin family protein n=1 Tax=Acinetobacter lanii TaxID=2715163 RepID=UPI00140E32EF|nr:pirin family protein [Acinetobacter lanii]NHC02447.1 pirin family protein [Acinetobacter lanii]
MNAIQKVYTSDRSTWVGDGFKTNSMLPMSDMSTATSPFLVMGYTAHYPFSPSNHQRGVGMHPHRGFETVTIVYEGELEHRDSKGNHGTIGKNEVQWMTAGRGIMHEEHHSKAFAHSGGHLDMVQLWVNLPSDSKMVEPRYQELTEQNIPEVTLKDEQGLVRVIAGEFVHEKAMAQGPALTYSKMNLLDARLKANKTAHFDFDPSWNNIIFVLSGKVSIDGESFTGLQTVYLNHDAASVEIEIEQDAKLLIASGEPILEPIVAHGPFVMNTEAEIHQAFRDFQSGHFA